MSWFLIVLGVMAYLHIGYRIGRIRRSVYNSPQRYSNLVQRAAFPVGGLFGTVGDTYSSMLVHKDDVDSDRNYLLIMSVAWGIYLVPAAVATIMYLLWGLLFLCTEAPGRLYALVTSKRANRKRPRPAAAKRTEPTGDAQPNRDSLLEERLESLETRVDSHERRLDGKDTPYR